MNERSIEIEADSLEEAKDRLMSMIPKGMDLLTSSIISDGEPTTKDKKKVLIEADSLEGAKARLRAQMPRGFEILQETLICSGELQTVNATADTVEDATTWAINKTPYNAEIVEKKILEAPKVESITFETFEGAWANTLAKKEASQLYGRNANVLKTELMHQGKKGFLGIGKKPHQFNADVLVRGATVEILYKPKVSIEAELALVEKHKAKITATVGSLADKLHEVVTTMCKNPGRSFNKKSHAAPLLELLSRSQIPKDVAELFVEATTFTAAFTEVRTTESLKALKRLCTIEGPVVDNLLHCIANMSDAEQTVNMIDMSGTSGSSNRTYQVSFEPQRNIARTELARRGSPGYDPRHYVRCSKQSTHKAMFANPATKGTNTSSQRLADPAHPARTQLEQVAKIIDKCVTVEVVGDRTATRISASLGEMQNALSILESAISACPDDMDILVAKADILHGSAQFASAEKVLDEVLRKAPDHFEAQMWKSHWDAWSNALRFPRWDERSSSLHSVMAFHLQHDHRGQVTRDGLQKALAIVTGVEGPPFDSRTQIDLEWVLSKTPYGPLVAYYVRIAEPSAEPSTMEAFLPIFEPTLFSPMEGYFLVQQLAFTPYCFVVLVNGNSVMLNRRIVLGQKAEQKVREIAAQLASTHSYLPQHQFKNAMQWHMNNFDMKQLRFA
jgi:hypothetical protein